MKTSLRLPFLILVLVIGAMLLSTTASAQSLPWLGAGGNYSYTDLGDGTGSLSFTVNYPNWATYTDFSGYDPLETILYTTEISFDSLTNSSGDPANFGSSSLSVHTIGSPSDVYFSADIDSFDTNLGWMHLSNVTAGDLGPGSRFVNEMFAVGNGTGNLQISFTPGVGGVEDFSGSSSGSVGIVIAAPEPISAVLFITGGATLALRRFRKKNN